MSSFLFAWQYAEKRMQNKIFNSTVDVFRRGAIVIIIAHGLCSSGLFSLVGIISLWWSTCRKVLKKYLYTVFWVEHEQTSKD